MPTSALTVLKDADAVSWPSVVVLHGSERFLQQTVLKNILQVADNSDSNNTVPPTATEDAELNLSRYDGKNLEWAAVSDELSTVSMFGEARQVVIDSADEFVSKNRPALEKYVAKPATKSRLVLLVKKWPKTTRLYKAVEKQGKNVNCDAPKPAELLAWLTQTCPVRHGKSLDRQGAATLLELVGPLVGRLDVELAKLAAFVGDRGKIEKKDVETLVGGWRAETTWELIDHLLRGDHSEAMRCLEKLLIAREPPLMILGGLVYKFRSIANATELSRGGQRLSQALAAAGVWKSQVAVAEQYLRRIGRKRAERLLHELLSTRDRLSGSRGAMSASQQRLELERLVLRLAGVDAAVTTAET